MNETRIKISSIIENQLPQFIKEDFPLVNEFLTQYYISLESKGSVYDLIQNIDKYVKIDNLTNLTESTTLAENISFFDTTIVVEGGTYGFPDSYGLLLINDEIVTYATKTEFTFEGCIRGFSGVTSYGNNDQLIFTESESQEHSSGTEIINLSILFLKEFFNKIRKQVTPGFEGRELFSGLNENIFIKQAIDFYSSKGTDTSFKILFGALYGENVEVIKPRDYLIIPSTAQYRVTSDLIVESVQGNPEQLVNGTLYQNETDFISAAQGTITNVEKFIKNSKEYYLVSLDSDYDKDILPSGTVYGKFTVHPKTKTTNFIQSGSNTLEVDSTVGFPNENGKLIVELDNNTILEITYENKTLNQFLNCSGITQEIKSFTEVRSDFYAYGINNNQEIRVRILGILSSLPIPDNTVLLSNDDEVRIKSLGEKSLDYKANNWFFNIPSSYLVKSIQLLDISDRSYLIETFNEHSIRRGDNITLISQTGEEKTGNVTSFVSKTLFTIQFGIDQFNINEELNLEQSYSIRKNLLKALSSNYPEVSKYTTNVQNVYVDNDSLYVASPSIPTYSSQPLRINDSSITISLNGNYENDGLYGTILTVGEHGFYTGDSVVVKQITGATLGISTGVYYIKKITGETIKLAKSRNNIFTNNFISLPENLINTTLKIELADFTNRDLSTKNLQPQKLIRKISTPTSDGKIYDTQSGFTGILINGVEILNYKSKDNVYYGPIESIIPVSSGFDYDVINPPLLTVNDSTGSGVSAYCSVDGNLKKINIVDAGFDYLEVPTIEISGGNGANAEAKANLVSFDHRVFFNSQETAGAVELNPVNSISFPNFHKFRDAEEVIYVTEGQNGISGLTTNSSYFVSIQDAYKIKLHKSFNDAVSGINTITINSYGTGIHHFRSRNKKRKIGSITIQNSGSDYQNKLCTTTPVGINTATDVITINDHNYQSGEIVVYNSTEISIGGLTSSFSYIVTRLDDNNIKLSQIGTSSAGINTTFYYDTKQYINLVSTGTGIHKFNYPEIKVNVKGRIGVSTFAGQDFNAIVQPIFRGGIQSVFVESGGNGYGAEDIINYNRQPIFSLNSGSGIELKPIVSNGRITNVLINSPGSGYNSIPDIEVIGDGVGATLTPIFSNGVLVEVKIIQEGNGYTQEKTSILVTPSGNGAKFEAKIKSWKINQVERLIKNKKIESDDGILSPGLNGNYELQYSHGYAPRLLRSLVQGVSFRDGVELYTADLQFLNEREQVSTVHSPIIGWAYDGNPVYGPYGYSTRTGGTIKNLTPSYKLTIKSSRPGGASESLYPFGFFVNDYEYTGDGDLDQHNGRFCITPDYPNGIYAYFATISNEEPEITGVFKNYKKPIFPYIIGPSYKSRPIEYNINPSSNQDFIDINDTKWKRNTTPYNLTGENNSISYFSNIDTLLSPKSTINSVSTGTINDIEIIESGDNYKVNDALVFTNSSNIISKAKAKVSSLLGKSITEINTETVEAENVQIVADGSYIGFSTNLTNFNTNDLITFYSNKEFNKLSGEIKVLQNTLSIGSTLYPTSITGIITDIKVIGDLNYPNLTVNSIFKVNDELIKVLNIDKNNSTIQIERNINSTVGVHTASIGELITEIPTKFKVNFGISTNSYNLSKNQSFYFSADKNVGLGTQYGVGITSTIFVDILRLNSRVSIGTGTTTSLYFNDLRDVKKYNLNDYVELANSTDVSFNTERKKVVSIGNTFINIDFNTSTLSGADVISFVNLHKTLSITPKSIRILNHNLKSVDPIIYTPPKNGSPIEISSTNIPGIGVTSTLPSSVNLYPIILDENTIGIATQPNSIIEDGLFFTNSGSNDLSLGEIHSFDVNYQDNSNYNNILTGKINKNLVTVYTSQPHELSLNDKIKLDVKIGVSTTFIIKYNDYNRRLIANPKTIVGINTSNSNITVNNHRFYTGQKVLYTSLAPSIGLIDQSLYYVVVVDTNTIRLSNTYFDSIKKEPSTINISSFSTGELFSVNPEFKVTRNQSIIFDLSDSSLSFISIGSTFSAFELKIYKDSNFIEEYDKSQQSSNFDVVRTGRVGIDSTAKLTITIKDDTPEQLYYKLVPVNTNLSPDVKKTNVIDEEVISFNKISIVNSVYNKTHNIVGVGSTYFQFNLLDVPEILLLTNETSQLKYSTISTSAKGGIESILITDKGRGYKTLPGITSVVTEDGEGSILSPITETIGKVRTVNLNDIGPEYFSDYSIRPTVKYPEILILNSLSTFDRIEILSLGKNYTIIPDLVVIDGLTSEVIDDVKLSYNFNDSFVNILKNTKKLSDIKPIIIPINNSNGIKINNITFNSATKDVTVSLGASFSDINDFPFEIGSKVLIEGISVGVGTIGKGYNSSNYAYSLFTLTGVTPSIGGAVGIVTYNLSSYLKGDETPGTYNSLFSSGKIIPESYFPVFNPITIKNTFYEGETVTSNEITGIVKNWDAFNQYLKVSTVDDFKIGDTITGNTSGSVGVIRKFYTSEGEYEIDSSTKVRKGWNTETGFLNNDFQRIHDSDYYQYFSYALKSKKDFSAWNDAVSTLNHTAGFKKFSNLIVESNQDNIGINTDQNQGDFIGAVDFSSVINLDCVYDFDLAKENNIIIDGEIKSDQIIFDSAIIQDYIESIGNRVLLIDDISSQFNSRPRATEFSIVDSFDLINFRSKKYISYINDLTFINEAEIGVITLIHNDTLGYANQYGNISSLNTLGFFDFTVIGDQGNLLYYPIKNEVNNYNIQLVSLSLNDNVSGIGTTSLGSSVKINVSESNVSSGSTIINIIGISTEYRSGKILVQIGATDSSYYEYNEITYVHNDSDVVFLDYGQLTTDINSPQSSVGIGTYLAYISGSNVYIDLIPSSSPTNIDYKINCFNVSLGNTSLTGVGTAIIGASSINSSNISIASSSSPISKIIGSYSNSSYNASYSFIGIEDLTNYEYQCSEIITLTNLEQSYSTEFGIITTNSSLGIITTGISGDDTYIYFTPIPNIDVDVKLFKIDIGVSNDTASQELSLISGSINYDFGEYTGKNNDVRKSFNITHNNIPVFQREFNASDSLIVNVSENTIRIPNHFYSTGEEINYSYEGNTTENSIGITTTSIVGIGTTDKLPSTLYVVKVDDLDIKVAASASDALKTIPLVLDINSVGVGTVHTFTSKKQNNKVIIGIDNVIQSPVVSTSTTSILSENVNLFDNQVIASDVSSIFGGDLIHINDEIMKVTAVGVGSTNSLQVIRAQLGTKLGVHSTSETVTKVYANYNIVDNTIYFAEAPYGNVPFVSIANRPDEQDYTGISTNSTFSGRVFLRSGITEGVDEAYSKNYIFDDFSNEFDGSEKSFTLKSNQTDIVGVSTDNAILLINSIFQGPLSSGITGDYELTENTGITSVTFTGNSNPTTYDVNTGSVPRGGIIVSVGSTQGFGYQPLVAAGGTAIVSIAGTIQSISIGNSGSGYRVGIQTIVNVGVKTDILETTKIEYVGIASISNGSIVGVSITNPGVGYTSSNPPIVVFDYPLSYSNIPLVYSTQSASGVGTGAKVDIIVSQGSSIFSFDITNLGYGYKSGEILTVSTNDIIGIPTTNTPSFSEFQIIIDRTQSDQISAWSIGSLQVIDPIDEFFDGERVSFPILIEGQQTTIRTKPGSNIDIDATLLIFINDVLQIPGKSYVFSGGSIITFIEPPKTGDKSKIIFYRGTGDVDTVLVDILESVKVGDKVSLKGDDLFLQQDERVITEIVSSDIARTNVYAGPGISRDQNLTRPLVWCKQREDLIINGNVVGKDRVLYEPYIQPSTNIIQNIGVSTNLIFVESIKTFFDSELEYTHDGTTEKPQNKIIVLSQDTLVSASATAVVSTSSTISNIIINDGGVGYTTSPTISISNPSGITSSVRAEATAQIINGSVVSVAIQTGGYGYDLENPPLVLIESPKLNYEIIEDISYEGDFGIITGVHTTSVGVASTGIIFDFYIPLDSPIRNNKIVTTGVATTGVSGIQTGYYFVINNSNIGSGVTSLDSTNNIVGIGTSFIDNVYEVASVSIGQTSVLGVGLTYVAKVTVSVSNYDNLSGFGFSSFYGNYSWGLISTPTRSNPLEFTSYSNVGGISTSPIVQRFNRLKYLNYNT